MASNLTVLYVEDEELLRTSMTQYLSQLFLSVDTAKDGQEGLEHFKNQEYDLIIADINMPKMDGITMLKKIRESNASQEAIILTAYNEEEYIQKADALHVQHYIPKPVDFDHLNQNLYEAVLSINNKKEK